MMGSGSEHPIGLLRRALFDPIDGLFKNPSELSRKMGESRGPYAGKPDAALSMLHRAFRGDRPFSAALVDSIREAVGDALRSRNELERQLEFETHFTAVVRAWGSSRVKVPPRSESIEALMEVHAQATDVLVWNGAPSGTLSAVQHPLRDLMHVKLNLRPGAARESNFIFIVEDIERAVRGWMALFDEVLKTQLPDGSFRTRDEVDELLQRLDADQESKAQLLIYAVNLPHAPISFVLHNRADATTMSCFLLATEASGATMALRQPNEVAHRFEMFCTTFLAKATRSTNLSRVRWDDVRQRMSPP